ncbi:MAG: ABC transporter permease subunit, partial [Betaproteobacteria bacterium]|nr:ABC transporter permease subunit [Betaproteobacteria bacterium]
ILAHRHPRYSKWILGGVGVLQIVPSLALLAILIVALGQIGTVPALLALFLYGLLPIVNATHIGLMEVPSHLKEAALALGCDQWRLLLSIELPHARPIIRTGFASATVIGVGTCTLAALVGAGGFGDRIVAGLAVNDHVLMLAGALPAAVLALLAQALLTPKR